MSVVEGKLLHNTLTAVFTTLGNAFFSAVLQLVCYTVMLKERKLNCTSVE